jgi:hypothetical protein
MTANRDHLTAADCDPLIRLLATTDSAFMPARQWLPLRLVPDRVLAAINQRRAEYLLDGVAMIGRGSAASRKSTERRWSRLESHGLIVITVKGGRQSGVKLTAAGDSTARTLAGLPTARDSWRLLARIGGLIDHGCAIKSPYHRGQSFVREDHLGLTGYSDREIAKTLIDLEIQLMPLLCRGLVCQSINGAGHWYLGLTPDGITGLNQPPPCLPANLPPYPGPRWWCDAYFELCDEIMASRESWRPPKANDLSIPLPEGIGPQRSFADLAAQFGHNRKRPAWMTQ